MFRHLSAVGRGGSSLSKAARVVLLPIRILQLFRWDPKAFPAQVMHNLSSAPDVEKLQREVARGHPNQGKQKGSSFDLTFFSSLSLPCLKGWRKF